VALHSSVLSKASLASHHRSDFKIAMDYIGDSVADLNNVIFPYLFSQKKIKPEPKSREKTYDEYFDEIDEIEAREKAENAQKSEGASEVESSDSKLV